jgi:major membrane immunogen (membrane-anchored lipoprotein)
MGQDETHVITELLTKMRRGLTFVVAASLLLLSCSEGRSSETADSGGVFHPSRNKLEMER